MKSEDAHTELGLIQLHEEAISSLALWACLEVEAVKSVEKTFWARINPFFSAKKKKASCIKVTIHKNSEEVSLEIPLIIKYGFNIPEVAKKVQENVRTAVEKMTNLTVKEVNVKVVGIERSGE